MNEADVLTRLAALGSSVTKAPVEDVAAALDEVRALLRATGAPFKIVGGLAVVHHSYARFTSDIDVLVDPGPPFMLETVLREDASGRLRVVDIVPERSSMVENYGDQLDVILTRKDMGFDYLAERLRRKIARTTC